MAMETFYRIISPYYCYRMHTVSTVFYPHVYRMCAVVSTVLASIDLDTSQSSMYLFEAPLLGGVGIQDGACHTRSADQSREERGNILGARANRARREGIYLERGPIARGEREYTWSAGQSREERGIYLERGPIARGEREYYRGGGVRGARL
eukprot:1179288-Prorocentrum_minimum.AAC.1